MIPDLLKWLVMAILALIALGSLFLVGKYFRLWLWATVTGTRISMAALVMMSLRKVNPRTIVEAKVMTVQAGLDSITTQALEAHVLAGGNLPQVVLALIVAHRAKISLNWDTAAAIDLAGRNVLEAVQVSVNPKVIDCPDPDVAGAAMVSAVAKDGIQLKVRVRVTVRTNLLQLIGGATEQTVIARIGEGVVSAIGSCETYAEALAEPVRISHQVMERGLDSQTAFSIVSIDIADIDVGENVGARLQTDQAEADIRIARAKAEERLAAAIAFEQEMKALTRENQARVVLAEAQVPAAIAHAFRAGQLGMDEPSETGRKSVAFTGFRLEDNGH